MKIAERQVGDVVILDLQGKILIGEGDDALRDAVAKLVDAGKTKIILNLAEVPYVDSAGLGEIVGCYTTVSRKGGKLKLVNLTKKITELPRHHQAPDRLRDLRHRGRSRHELRLKTEADTPRPTGGSAPRRPDSLRPPRMLHGTPPCGPGSGPRTCSCSRPWRSPSTSSSSGPFSAPLGAFVLFCGLAGAVYLLNDLVDLERDRLHPTKRPRPLASGALPVAWRDGRSACCFAVCRRGGVDPRPGFLLCALAYLVLDLAYSLGLKHVVILDVLRRGPRLRAAGRGGRRRDRRALQPLAPGLHDPAGAVPGPRQAPARARDARGRGGPPPDPRRVQPVPARPDDRAS